MENGSSNNDVLLADFFDAFFAGQQKWVVALILLVVEMCTSNHSARTNPSLIPQSAHALIVTNWDDPSEHVETKEHRLKTSKCRIVER